MIVRRAKKLAEEVCLSLARSDLVCASLTVVDVDTVKCDGQNVRLLGVKRSSCLRSRHAAFRKSSRIHEGTQADAATAEIDVGRGRPNGRVLLDGRQDPCPTTAGEHLPERRTEVGQTLLKEGSAKRWQAGHRDDWCE